VARRAQGGAQLRASRSEDDDWTDHLSRIRPTNGTGDKAAEIKPSDTATSDKAGPVYTGDWNRDDDDPPTRGGGSYARGGRLTAKTRKALPSKDFALPGRRYPVEDKSHARNALARVAQHGSPAEKATVRRKVASKYPGIKQG